MNAYPNLPGKTVSTQTWLGGLLLVPEVLAEVPVHWTHVKVQKDEPHTFGYYEDSIIVSTWPEPSMYYFLFFVPLGHVQALLVGPNPAPVSLIAESGHRVDFFTHAAVWHEPTHAAVEDDGKGTTDLSWSYKTGQWLVMKASDMDGKSITIYTNSG